MTRKIPIAVIATVADVLAPRFTHNRIDHFMERAGIEGEILPGLNKVDKTRAWLKIANDKCSDPLAALGLVLIELMEVDGWVGDRDLSADRDKVHRALAVQGLAYLNGGQIIASSATAVSRGLEDIIRDRDLVGLRTEFDRIFANVDKDPAAAVTASSALLESLFKTYIEDEDLSMPADKSIKPLWKTVRSDLKLDPAAMGDEDLRTVLTGLAAVVEGLGALRTHKGSAHGQGSKTAYKLSPRHARFAANASFTIASFVLEAWRERTNKQI